MSQQSETRIRNLNFVGLPQPLSESCRSYINLKDDNWAEKTSRLKELYEVVVKLLAIISVKAYVTQKDSNSADTSSELLDSRVQKLANPSLGDWAGSLRDAVTFFASKGEEAPAFVRPIIAYYKSALPDGRNGEVYQAYSGLCAYLSIQPGKPAIQSLFDFLVSARNKLGSGGHGASLNVVDTQAIAIQLETLVAHLLARLDLLSSFELIYINAVSKHKGRTVYDAKVFSRIYITNERLLQAPLDYDLCMDGEVYLAEVDKEQDEGLVLTNALSLSPLLAFQHCSSTKSEQLFFFNGKRGQSLEYLCYVTGTYYFPPDLEKEFDNIAKVISGELRASEVFGQQRLEEGKVATIEDRKNAEDLAEEAMLHLRQSAPELAIKVSDSALKLNRHCASAVFAKGLAFCLLGRTREALKCFDEAANLSPDSIPHHLALGMTLAAEDQLDKSLDRFRKIKKFESTNELAACVLADPDHIDSLLFAGNITTEEKLQTVFQTVLKHVDEDQFDITAWLFRLHPWKAILRCTQSKTLPVPPVFMALLGSIGLFLLPVVAHLPVLSQWGWIAPPSIAFYLRHLVIAIVCFFGFFNIFAFNRILLRIYANLRKITLIPKAAMRQWYAAEMARCWGSGNIRDAADDPLSTKGLAHKDKWFFLAYLAVAVAFLPFHIKCSGDWNPWLPYPSEMGSSVPVALLEGVRLSPAWAILQFIVRQAVYCFQVFLCAYGVTMILPVLFFIPRILNLPIRYYPGIPDSLTLRTIACQFLNFSVLATLFCIFATAQLYVFDCFTLTPLSTIVYVVTISVFLPIYVVAPVLATMAAMRAQRAAVLEEFASNVEGAYNKCVATPDAKGYETITTAILFSAKLRSMCPVWPLTWPGTAFMILMLAAFAIAMAGYTYLAMWLDWPKF